MNRWLGTLSGLLGIVAVVSAGIWHANDPEMRIFPLSDHTTAGATTDSFPEISVNRIHWSNGGRAILSLSRGGFNAKPQLLLHDIRRKTTLPIYAMGDWVEAAALTPDGHQVLYGTIEGGLWWVAPGSAEAPTLLVKLADSEDSFSATAIAGNGRQVAGGTQAGLICVRDLGCATCVTLPCNTTSAIVGLHFSNNASRLLCAQTNGRISIWDLSTGTLMKELLACKIPLQTAEFLPDGDRLISASGGNLVQIWDIASGRELWRHECDPSDIGNLAVAADGTTAAWGGHNHKIVVWSLEHGEKKFEIPISEAAVFHLAFSPDDSLLAAAGRQGMLCLYDALTGAEHDRFEIDAMSRAYPDDN
jgi:WD40 repeat protein